MEHEKSAGHARKAPPTGSFDASTAQMHELYGQSPSASNLAQQRRIHTASVPGAASRDSFPRNLPQPSSQMHAGAAYPMEPTPKGVPMQYHPAYGYGASSQAPKVRYHFGADALHDETYPAPALVYSHSPSHYPAAFASYHPQQPNALQGAPPHHIPANIAGSFHGHLPPSNPLHAMPSHHEFRSDLEQQEKAFLQSTGNSKLKDARTQTMVPATLTALASHSTVAPVSLGDKLHRESAHPIPPASSSVAVAEAAKPESRTRSIKAAGYVSASAKTPSARSTPTKKKPTVLELEDSEEFEDDAPLISPQSSIEIPMPPVTIKKAGAKKSAPAAPKANKAAPTPKAKTSSAKTRNASSRSTTSSTAAPPRAEAPIEIISSDTPESPPATLSAPVEDDNKLETSIAADALQAEASEPILSKSDVNESVATDAPLTSRSTAEDKDDDTPSPTPLDATSDLDFSMNQSVADDAASDSPAKPRSKKKMTAAAKKAAAREKAALRKAKAAAAKATASEVEPIQIDDTEAEETTTAPAETEQNDETEIAAVDVPISPIADPSTSEPTKSQDTPSTASKPTNSPTELAKGQNKESTSIADIAAEPPTSVTPTAESSTIPTEDSEPVVPTADASEVAEESVAKPILSAPIPTLAASHSDTLVPSIIASKEPSGLSASEALPTKAPAALSHQPTTESLPALLTHLTTPIIISPIATPAHAEPTHPEPVRTLSQPQLVRDTSYILTPTVKSSPAPADGKSRTKRTGALVGLPKKKQSWQDEDVEEEEVENSETQLAAQRAFKKLPKIDPKFYSKLEILPEDETKTELYLQKTHEETMKLAPIISTVSYRILDDGKQDLSGLTAQLHPSRLSAWIKTELGPNLLHQWPPTFPAPEHNSVHPNALFADEYTTPHVLLQFKRADGSYGGAPGSYTNSPSNCHETVDEDTFTVAVRPSLKPLKSILKKPSPSAVTALCIEEVTSESAVLPSPPPSESPADGSKTDARKVHFGKATMSYTHETPYAEAEARVRREVFAETHRSSTHRTVLKQLQETLSKLSGDLCDKHVPLELAAKVVSLNLASYDVNAIDDLTAHFIVRKSTYVKETPEKTDPKPLAQIWLKVLGHHSMTSNGPYWNIESIMRAQWLRTRCVYELNHKLINAKTGRRPKVVPPTWVEWTDVVRGVQKLIFGRSESVLKFDFTPKSFDDYGWTHPDGTPVKVPKARLIAPPRSTEDESSESASDSEASIPASSKSAKTTSSKKLAKPTSAAAKKAEAAAAKKAAEAQRAEAAKAAKVTAPQVAGVKRAGVALLPVLAAPTAADAPSTPRGRKTTAGKRSEEDADADAPAAKRRVHFGTGAPAAPSHVLIDLDRAESAGTLQAPADDAIIEPESKSPAKKTKASPKKKTVSPPPAPRSSAKSASSAAASISSDQKDEEDYEGPLDASARRNAPKASSAAVAKSSAHKATSAVSASNANALSLSRLGSLALTQTPLTTNVQLKPLLAPSNPVFSFIKQVSTPNVDVNALIEQFTDSVASLEKRCGDLFVRFVSVHANLLHNSTRVAGNIGRSVTSSGQESFFRSSSPSANAALDWTLNVSLQAPPLFATSSGSPIVARSALSSSGALPSLTSSPPRVGSGNELPVERSNPAKRNFAVFSPTQDHGASSSGNATSIEGRSSDSAAAHSGSPPDPKKPFTKLPTDAPVGDAATAALFVLAQRISQHSDALTLFICHAVDAAIIRYRQDHIDWTAFEDNAPAPISSKEIHELGQVFYLFTSELVSRATAMELRVSPIFNVKVPSRHVLDTMKRIRADDLTFAGLGIDDTDGDSNPVRILKDLIAAHYANEMAQAVLLELLRRTPSLSAPGLTVAQAKAILTQCVPEDEEALVPPTKVD